MENIDQKKKLLQFPCDFPLVVVCEDKEEVIEKAVSIVVENDKAFTFEEHLKKNPSKQGNYVSLRFHLHAISQEQLDKIYSEMTKVEGVKFVL